ncbi:LysM peptidoglycan-binding domain-containing protein [Lysinibacillus sp. 54212]|uniref:LysM peptidoglycan-binding domain-containing protein n=1 Tax=Lysinibacillus sp. 54212 TaxID=3119829 RepID=UPI002FC7C594
MIKQLKVELIVLDIKRNIYYGFPVLPPTIQYTNGDTSVHSINILDLGNVEVPNGRDLDSFGWNAEFPARHDPGYVVIDKSRLRKPLEYKKIFEELKESRATVQVICPVLAINKKMFIQSFNPEFTGYEGDIKYSINFRERREVKPKKLTIGGTAPAKGTKQSADREAVKPQATAKTYTVVRGDTLIRIAKKLGIKDWRAKLYEPNKKVIGSDPNKIKPGQVLKV